MTRVAPHLRWRPYVRKPRQGVSGALPGLFRTAGLLPVVSSYGCPLALSLRLAASLAIAIAATPAAAAAPGSAGVGRAGSMQSRSLVPPPKPTPQPTTLCGENPLNPQASVEIELRASIAAEVPRARAIGRPFGAALGRLFRGPGGRPRGRGPAGSVIPAAVWRRREYGLRGCRGGYVRRDAWHGLADYQSSDDHLDVELRPRCPETTRERCAQCGSPAVRCGATLCGRCAEAPDAIQQKPVPDGDGGRGSDDDGGVLPPCRGKVNR